MATVSTRVTVPYPHDKAVVAAQDVLDRLQWRVLDLSSERMIVRATNSNGWGLKMTVLLYGRGDETDVEVSASWLGAAGRDKEFMAGQIGKFLNGLSLRIQTDSVAINPTVAIGEGEDTSEDRISQLERLAELARSGVLTRAEFEAEKRRILRAD